MTAQRSTRDDEPRISREEIPEALLPWMTPKSSVKVSRSASTGAYGYELKVFVETAEEALDPDVVLAQIAAFDAAFCQRFGRGTGKGQRP